MGLRRPDSQFAQPLLVSGGGAVGKLVQIHIGRGVDISQPKRDEAWLQRLIQRHPECLPISEIEPGFGRLVAVGMELSVKGVFVDNLFATSDGDLVIVECKLWSNPEARRHVVAQIIEYAQRMTSWTYEELDASARRSLSLDGKPLAKSLFEAVSAVSEGQELDEAAFIDAVQRNLRKGRLLLLIAGEGIREDAESLTTFLQVHAGFHFTLALVEIALYELPAGGGLLVQPRVLARTLNIERAIVSFGAAPAGVSVAVSTPEAAAGPALSLTESGFFERLGRVSPETAKALQDFMKLAQDEGVYAEASAKSLMLRWSAPDRDDAFSLGGVDSEGRLTTFSVCWRPNAIGAVELGHRYLRALSALVPGEVRETKGPENWYVVEHGKSLPPALAVLRKSQDWLRAIVDYKRELLDALKQ